MYGVVSADFKDKNSDGGDEDVDEHHLHATILEQLQHLKSTTTVRLLSLSPAIICSCGSTHASLLRYSVLRDHTREYLHLVLAHGMRTP